MKKKHKGERRFCDVDDPISTGSMDAILRFLPAFESDDFKFGEFEEFKQNEDGAWVLPHCIFTDEANDFMRALYDNNWIAPFDWPSWQEEAWKFVDSPELLKTADAKTLRKLLTLHARKERFCEGHLLAMFESGHITAILRRLQEIRMQMEAE